MRVAPGTRGAMARGGGGRDAGTAGRRTVGRPGADQVGRVRGVGAPMAARRGRAGRGGRVAVVVGGASGASTGDVRPGPVLASRQRVRPRPRPPHSGAASDNSTRVGRQDGDASRGAACHRATAAVNACHPVATRRRPAQGCVRSGAPTRRSRGVGSHPLPGPPKPSASGWQLGRGVAQRWRTCFGSTRLWVRIPPPRPISPFRVTATAPGRRSP
jgi:hypothetical protein